MLCSRFLKASHVANEGRFFRATERIFTGLARPLRADAPLGARAAERDADRVGGPLPRHGAPLRRDPEGLPHERRHRPVHRLHRGAARRVVRGDVAPPEGGRGPHPETPGRQRRLLDRRGERREPGGQLGKPPRPPQAARGPQAGRRRRSSRSSGRSSRQCPESASSSRTRRPSRSAGRSRAARTSSRSRARTAPSSARVTEQLEAKVKALPGLIDVTTDLQNKNPQLAVTIDRDKASAMGLTASQVEDALNNSYGTRQVSTIYTSTNEYQVILELLPEYQTNPAALSLLYVRNAAGTLIPLSSVARFDESAGPARREPPRAGPVRDGLLQRAAGRRARRRDRAGAEGRGRDPPRSRSRPRSRARRRSSSRPSAASRSSSRSRSS